MSSDQLFKATDRGETEATFFEVLRGCGETEVKYRDGDGETVLMQMARGHNWLTAADAVIERGCGEREGQVWGHGAALRCRNEHPRARICLAWRRPRD